MKVTNDIFSTLWEHRGGAFGQPGDKYQEFLYSGLTESVPLGKRYAHIPPLGNAQLTDWDALEYWLQEIHHSFTLLDFLHFTEKEIDFDTSIPVEAFGSSSQVLEAATNLVKRSGDQFSNRDIWVTEINHGNKHLFMLYSDLDGWGLGHSYEVEIVESLNTFTEENGYFETQ